MHQVAGGFLMGVYLVGLGIGDGNLRTNEDLSQNAIPPFFGRIDGKGDAVCRAGIIKKKRVKTTNLFFSHEMDMDFIRGDAQKIKKKRDQPFDRGCCNRQVSLFVIKEDLHRGKIMSLRGNRRFR